MDYTKQINYIFYAAFSDYWKIANNDLYTHNSVHVCEGIDNSFLNKINTVHNSWTLNRKKELPLKKIWFNKYSCSEYLRENIKQFAIFPEANSLSFSGKYLSYLRANYPKLVMIFNFSNLCGKYNMEKLESVRQYYDHIITFNKTDSLKHGFELLPINGYSRVNVPESNIPESDLFFVGQDKGRLPILINIYDRLTKLGLKCDFSIVNVQEKDIVKRKGITFNQRMSYMEVLQHVQKTKCILELLEGNNDYSSIRTSEALTYHRKLITMSPSIRNSEFYSPTQMLFIESPNTISRDFFEIPIENSYNIMDYSPIKGLATISKLERTKP